MDRAPTITVHAETVTANVKGRYRIRLQTFLDPWTYEPQYAVSVERGKPHSGTDIQDGHHPYQLERSNVWNDPRDAVADYWSTVEDRQLCVHTHLLP